MSKSTGVRVRWAVAVLLPAILLAPSAVRGDHCGDSGADGAFSGAGVVNTYYPPGAAGSIDPTTLTLNLGTATGAAATLKFGAMLLIIQMQDAEFNAQDDNHYGDGSVESPSSISDPGSGATRLNSTGLYEYVIVDDGVTAFGTNVPSLAAVPFVGEGPNGKLINTYTYAVSTGARGQSRYQIIRVPQYTSLTLNSGLTARAWDGSTGGVLAVDVRDAVVLNNATVSVMGLGFRAGLGEKLSSVNGVPNFVNTAYRRTTSDSAFGNKGEGIAGTPKNMAGGIVNPEPGDGYPNGSRARGAPGNAGGGGNPQNANNTDSSGGGGGGNGGGGGTGGESGNGHLPIGGFGGSAFVVPTAPPTPPPPGWGPGCVIMGGGGGSGVKNNTAPPGSADGGAGGGIVFIRATGISNGGGATTATINANGAPGHDGNNNGGGGGGAGGSVIFTILTGNLNGVTINANGGDGGPAGTGTNQYGPGGGGGGGVVMTSATGATVNTNPGVNGLTNGASLGAAPGVLGSPPPGDPNNPFVSPSSIPGVHSGAECNQFLARPDTYSTPQDTPLSVTAPGVLGNDTLPQPGTYNAVLDTTTPNGTLTLNADGSFDYTPNLGFAGDDTFTYHALETVGNTPSNTVTVTIHVGVPTANPDSYDVNEDATLTVLVGAGVLVNDNANGGSITAVQDTGPVDSFNNPFGSLSLSSDGSFTYTPDPLPRPQPSIFNVTFTYHAHKTALDSAPTTVTIHIHHINHAPVAVNDPQYSMLPNTTLDTTNPPIAGVLANDTDSDLDALTAVLNTGPVDSLSNPTGVLVLNSNGSLTYTPPAAFTGVVTFTYFANDGTTDSAAPATVTITVKVDQPPVAVDDNYQTPHDTPLVVAAAGVLANDSDPDADPLTAVLVSGTTNGAIVLAADGSFTYTPSAGFWGTDSFTYQASDGTLTSGVATVTITVVPPGTKEHPAGYCGLIALDAMFPLGILWLVRRNRLGRWPRD